MNIATSEDLVKRNFTAPTPNALWLTDITEHKTREGTLYCCAVLDQCSRRVVGWAIDRRNEATLVNDALTMAASFTNHLTFDDPAQRSSFAIHVLVVHPEPEASQAARLHGDRRRLLRQRPMESFWGSMQIELLNRQKWLTYVELATAMADYIVNFYNPLRRYSSLDGLTPDEFEALRSDHTKARILTTVGQ